MEPKKLYVYVLCSDMTCKDVGVLVQDPLYPFDPAELNRKLCGPWQCEFVSKGDRITHIKIYIYIYYS